MPRCLAALAALLLVACVVEREPERDGSFESGDESPAAAVDAPSPVEPADVAEPEPQPEPQPELEPSAPAPSDEDPSPQAHSDEPEFVPALPRAVFPSPATRDDEPAPAPEPLPEPLPEPEPSPEASDDEVGGTVEGGDLCTADEQCVAGLTCAPVYAIAGAGLGLVRLDERRCAYTP